MLVGLVAVYADDNMHAGYLTNVSVVPRYHRMGLATQLLDQCVTAAVKGRSYSLIRLEVDASNGPARGLYEGKGFRISGTSGTTLLMELTL